MKTSSARLPICPSASLLAVALIAGTRLFAASPVTITVNEGALKAFGGYGFTIDDGTAAEIRTWPEEERDRLGQLCWVEADFRLIRLWAHDRGSIDDMTREIGDACKWFVEEVRERHRPDLHVLLGPTQNTIAGVEEYSDFYVEMIRKLRDEYDFQIDATGIVNEPNANGMRFTTGEMPAAVKAFRRKLDAIDMQDVKIIAPEVSNVDAGGYAYGRALTGDAEAWEILDGFGTHSYGIAMTKDMMDIVGPEKDHYMTESSGSDVHTAAKAIADVNLGVTHWYFFFGYQGGSCGTYCLIQYNGGKGTPQGKFYVLKEYSLALTAGTRMRFCHTNLSGEVNEYMECNRVKGPLPPICCAAGVNPKGAWVVCLSNNSGYSTSGQYGWAGSPRASYDVTIDVEELHGEGDLDFTVLRIGHESGQMLGESELTMSDGRLVVPNFEPLTSAVLRAKESTEVPTTMPTQEHVANVPLRVARMGPVVLAAFSVNTASEISVSLYDVAGRIVRTLMSGWADAGEHTIRFDSRSMAPGTYVVVLAQGNTRYMSRLAVRP